MYGDPLEHPQKETYWGNVNPTGERSCYDEGKRAAECLTFDYQREHGMEARAERFVIPAGNLILLVGIGVSLEIIGDSVS